MSQIRFRVFAEREPEALALVDPQGRTWSREALAAIVSRLARALRRSGLAKGDVLALVAPNGCEYMAGYLAATEIGLYVVPINWHLSRDEILYILEDCRATALLAHERFAAAMQDVVARMKAPPGVRVAFGQIAGFEALEDFTADTSADPLDAPVTGRVLSYTSATTGKPKGVVLALERAGEALDQSIRLRRAVGTEVAEHVQLIASMLYHGAPLETAAVALHMGHVVVLVDAAHPERVLQLIQEYGVTLLYMVPTMFARLLSLSEATRSRYSLATLRRLVHGGAPCPVEVKRRMIEWLGPILWEAYGATEGAGTIVGSSDWLKHPGTVGRPMPGTTLKILGDDGEELVPGAVGTIYISRYTGDRFHYLGDPEKTRACFRGELFTVGDVGYVDDEGFLFICDRKIDMIICSGMKVYSAEVEGVLALHPGVADCAVFGIPDTLSGEAVVAVVESVLPEPGRELDLDMRRFIAARLSAAKVPRRVIFTDKLPRDPSGKLQKRRLRQRYLEEGRAAAES
jgi:long-chain acyl-CoA synthetase